MNTQIVYTIVSKPEDCYFEQLLFSLYSLRRYNRDASVRVIMDKETEQTLSGHRAQLHDLVSEIVVIETPQALNQTQRSRFLKTNLRKFIKGDYLFIDTDTVICGSLADIDSTAADIALVYDCNDAHALSEQSVEEVCQKAGFGGMLGQEYFNSGVIFARDTEKVHLFYERWYKNWLQSVENEVQMDQPAFNFTNHQMWNIISALPDKWNCQIYFNGYPSLPQAKIIHYAGGGTKPELARIYDLVKKEGTRSKQLRKYIAHPKTSLYAYLVAQDKSIKMRLYHCLYIKLNSSFWRKR